MYEPGEEIPAGDQGLLGPVFNGLRGVAICCSENVFDRIGDLQGGLSSN